MGSACGSVRAPAGRNDLPGSTVPTPTTPKAIRLTPASHSGRPTSAGVGSRDPSRPARRYRGLSLGMVLHPGGAAKAFLGEAAVHYGILSRDHQGPRVVLHTLNRLGASYSASCVSVSQSWRSPKARFGTARPRHAAPRRAAAAAEEPVTARVRRCRAAAAAARRPDAEPWPEEWPSTGADLVLHHADHREWLAHDRRREGCRIGPR